MGGGTHGGSSRDDDDDDGSDGVSYRILGEAPIPIRMKHVCGEHARID